MRITCTLFTAVVSCLLSALYPQAAGANLEDCKLRAFNNRTNSTKQDQLPQPHNGGTGGGLSRGQGLVRICPRFFIASCCRMAVLHWCLVVVSSYILAKHYPTWRKSQTRATHSVQTLHAARAKESCCRAQPPEGHGSNIVLCNCLFCSIGNTKFTSERTMAHAACCAFIL